MKLIMLKKPEKDWNKSNNEINYSNKTNGKAPKGQK